MHLLDVKACIEAVGFHDWDAGQQRARALGLSAHKIWGDHEGRPGRNSKLFFPTSP